MKSLILPLLSIAAFGSSATAGLIIPSGVQKNVSKSTVSSWGFNVLYSGLYGSEVSIQQAFANVAPDDFIMYAARPVGSDTYTLLAAAKAFDVMTVTDENGTTFSNGVEWYFNRYSLGFAPGGSTIYQDTADTTDSDLFDWPSDGSGSERLSWHTTGDDSSPLFINGGWRAGTFTFLNDSTEWERLILTTGTPGEMSAIPETSNVIAIGGLISVGAFLRSRRSPSCKA